MEYVASGSAAGIDVPAPFARSIQVLFAPDVRGVDELTFSLVQIEPGAGTDSHMHDRPELIHIVAGSGRAKVDDKEFDVSGGDVMYIRKGEWHQLTATGSDQLEIATVFTPGITAEQNYNRCTTAAAGDQAPSDTQ